MSTPLNRVGAPAVVPTGIERHMATEDIIVTKTDPKGRITYANKVFCRMAGYTERELLGAPHNIIRHPEMPAGVFKVLWDTISSGQEIFGFVLNLARDGSHYWVFAHVTPTFGPDGRIVGYHSNRRSPNRAALPAVQRVYQAMLTEERKHHDRRGAAAAGASVLFAELDRMGLTYDQLVWALEGSGRGAA